MPGHELRMQFEEDTFLSWWRRGWVGRARRHLPPGRRWVTKVSDSNTFRPFGHELGGPYWAWVGQEAASPGLMLAGFGP